MSKNHSPGSTRATRSDGGATRAHILEVAGQLFAERGYANTTSKIICERAQANMAAVNYHFGGLAGLYQEVLREVHRQLMSLDYLTELANSPHPPRDKLALFIDGIVIDLIENHSWHTRLWAREIVTPSPFAADIIQMEALPKFGIIRNILADMTGLPADSPILMRCLHTVMAPCVMLLVVSRELETPMQPLFCQDAQAVAGHIKTFTFAGLDAVVAQAAEVSGSTSLSLSKA